MKKLITFLIICTTVAILALPIAARNLIAQPAGSEPQDACSEENKDALYAAFRDKRTADQAKAYEAAKKYLACPAPAEVTESQKKIVDYLTKWVAAYDDAAKKAKLRTLLYNDMKYPEAYAIGKEILATEPDNLKVLIDLGANGYLVGPLNNAMLTSQALEHAKLALSMLESGKSLEDWQPLASRDVAVAYLNYTIGALTLERDPSSALKYLIKAAQFETPLKKSPFTFTYIAGAYELGPYAKQSADYKAIFFGKDETPESKLALANINQLVDRIIDGYARAVALAGSDAKFTAQKAIWNENLTKWYKYRNNEDVAGLDSMIASILSKPLPPEPTPLTSLPASTPAATPAGTSATPDGDSKAAGSPNSTSSTPAGTAANKTAPAANAKPASGKPDRPRN